MSWDLLVLAAPVGVPVEAVTEENTPPLGARDDVVAAIRAALPEAEPSGRYVRIEGETFTVELNLGEDDTVGHLGVRAQGDDHAVEPLVRLCAHTGWRAYDISTGEFLDEAEDPATGLRGWRAFRDSVIDDS